MALNTYTCEIQDEEENVLHGFNLLATNLRVAMELAVSQIALRDVGHGQTATKVTIYLKEKA